MSGSVGESPAVTALMIVKDRAAQIPAAVASILAQDMSDWELVVVDDGSRDDSAGAALLAAGSDPRVRVIPNTKAPGIPGARNAGLAQARGRYLAICDSDDLSRTHRFSVQAAALGDDPRLGGVGGNIQFFHQRPGDGEVPAWRWGVRRGRPPFPFPAAMFRVSALRQVGGFDQDYPVAEDVALAYDLAAAGWGLRLMDGVMIDYRRQSPDNTFSHPRRHRLTLRAQLHGVRVMRGGLSPTGYAALVQSGWRSAAEGYRNRFSSATTR